MRRHLSYLAPLRSLIATALLLTAACESETTTPTPAAPELTTVTAALSLSSVEVGQTTTATAAGLDQHGDAFATGTVIWTTTAQGVATVSETGVVSPIAAGTTGVVATAGGKSGQATLTVVAPPTVLVNEIESNGGTPGDWAEFYNPGAAAVDLTGWVFKDNDDTHSYTLPAGSTIPSGGYLVVEEAQFGFGFGSADAVRLYSKFGVLVVAESWTAHSPTTLGYCVSGAGAITNMTTPTKGGANNCSLAVKVNEVESNGGTPGDWVEFFNAGPNPADISGYIFKDNDDTHNYPLPAGSIIQPGGFLVIDEAAFGFGLGGADAARLFTATGTVVDSYTWDVHAGITYGRCPDGTGTFAATTTSTKAAANLCTAVGPTTGIWPGQDNVATVDGVSVFGSNLSGLTYEGANGPNPAYLWAVRNGPGTLYRMIWNGSIWTPDPASDWGVGKALRYMDGLGNPDAEGVAYGATGGASGIYVATERNNDASTISRSSILRFDPAAVGATLTATNDWNITADLPVVGANLGIEAITWISDAYLTSQGFYDEKAGHLYVPSEYPNHGTGLFFVGVEANGMLYAYALDHVTNGYNRLATIATAYTGVMGLEFDRELNYLWATCDDGCGGKSQTLEINAQGRFVVTRIFDRPGTMANLNNEGFAIAPQSECVGGFKSVFWADDGETGGHSIRRATLPCVRFP